MRSLDLRPPNDCLGKHGLIFMEEHHGISARVSLISFRKPMIRFSGDEKDGRRDGKSEVRPTKYRHPW